MTDAANAAIQNRPYRSHRVPACNRCRKRKIRCIIDLPGQPCLSCRERRLTCQYTDSILSASGSPEGEDGPERSNPKRPRLSVYGVAADNAARSHSDSLIPEAGASTAAKSSIILGPTVSEDVEIFQRHILKHEAKQGDQINSYQSVSHDPRNPTFYYSVPRTRRGLLPENSGKAELEIIEQIIGPFRREVIDLYFIYVHPHIPILDNETCHKLRSGLIHEINPVLASVVYTYACFHWYKSSTLKIHPRPDAHFLWNKAIWGILHDFMSPTFSTIACAVLDLMGRPSEAIVGNSILCGRTVALAQNFGLHRDPSKWNISSDEKSTRVRLWWTVIINDCWTSLAYGTPPRIARGSYDVQIPSLESILPPKPSPEYKIASVCFVHFCSLTELLGDVLPLVYHLKPDPQELSNAVQRSKLSLADLEAQLPTWMPLPDHTGTSNLHFCFLSVRLLLSRLALRAAIQTGDGTDTGSKEECLEELTLSSSALLDFVLYLGESNFLDYWLPHTGHLLVLATNISLRCTVEAQDNEARNASISRLQRLISHIGTARKLYDWDIADACLERCSEPVSKIAALASAESHLTVENSTTDVIESGVNFSMPALDDPSFLSEFLDSTNTFDFSWDALWDTPAGMSNFTI